MRARSGTVERLVEDGFMATFGVVGGRLRADTGRTFAAHETDCPRQPCRRARLIASPRSPVLPRSPRGPSPGCRGADRGATAGRDRRAAPIHEGPIGTRDDGD